MATPPSSRSPSPTKPSAPDSPAAADTAAAAAASPPAKPTPTAWSHQETVHLIHLYQDKWYSNNRAALKAPQWEQIATAVADRSGGSGMLPPKTPTQCRHKMEKLRKRFRSERQRGGGGPTGWPYYDLMDRLERGPKAPARPITVVPARNQNFHSNTRNFRGHRNDYEDEEDEDDYGQDVDNDEDEDDSPYGRSQSINYILRRPTVVKRFPSDRSFPSSAVPGFVPRHLEAPKRARDDVEADEQMAAREENERMRRAAFSELAGEIRAFAETYVGMENVKMEMMREAERSRLEMETKRMEMILESQRKIVEAIAEAFGGPEKGTIKIDPEL